MLCSLRKIKSWKDDNKRYNFKYELTKLLFSKGYDKEIIHKLFTFINGLLSLPKGLELEYNEKVEEIIGGNKVEVTLDMTNYGKALISKGKEEGREEGKQEGIKLGEERGIKLGKIIDKRKTIKKILTKRLGKCDDKLMIKINAIEDLDILDEIIDDCLDITDISILDKHFS